MDADATDPPPPVSNPSGDQVSVVIIAFNDAAHVRDAITSALDQGTAVHEVIAVDDASTDATGALLDAAAARDPRVRVHHRTVNSGGCGTPRNDGLRLATGRWVMFLDSDDVLPAKAVTTLLDAARASDAQVAAGACVRRELPLGREVRWQPTLYREARTYATPTAEPRLVRDTLCVGKLYDRAFLHGHGVEFPEGRFLYEDFVFAARLLAASPRLTLVPDTVYVWHVRRNSASPSLSLNRREIANWQARLEAHHCGTDILRAAGRKDLVSAAHTKFVDHDVRMYLRELHTHDEQYQRRWWQLTRDYLADFPVRDVDAARAPARWCTRVILASDVPVDLARLIELAARPGRLLPPYAVTDGRAVWSTALPRVTLDDILTKPVGRLPLTVTAEVSLGRRTRLRLRVDDLYGRLAEARPVTIDLEVSPRTAPDRPLPYATAPLSAAPGGDAWTAELEIDLRQLAVHSSGHGHPEAWDLAVVVHCADGTQARAVPRPGGGPLRRAAVPTFGGLLLLQPYRTTGGALAFRMARGLDGATRLLARRARRLLAGR
ncbi:glycosyltransferase family 2 protein [Streptomyces sp. NPDC102279]|uniref:glycosyltransferase family 2 protein n=1 Tax=Streptomyces sp. NPDC102279 TaxID=3366153 RepID=UPI0038218C12